MRLCRIAPEGLYAVLERDNTCRLLYSDPLKTPRDTWETGRVLEPEGLRLLPPATPGKIVAAARSYPAHADELRNPRPNEPLFFLKSPSAIIGSGSPIVVPPESSRVDYEGEVAVVVKDSLRRATPEQAEEAILGVTCACDVTARDLQRRWGSFSAAKSFDSFCPLGPVILLDPDLDSLKLSTRINGETRQQAMLNEMAWPLSELLSQASSIFTFEPGDLFLTGTPSGVGALATGDLVEIEVSGVGVLSNRVETMRQ